MIEDLIIHGAVLGAMYTLLALGFTLIYGVAEVVNMAHGALFMLGAYMFFAFGSPRSPFFQLELLPALILAVILVAIAGVIFYRLLIHPIIEDALAVLVVTVGGSLILQQIILNVFGGRQAAVAIAFPKWVWLESVEILGVRVVNSELLSAVVSLILFGILWIFIAKSKMGRAMRAVAQDHEVAMLMGINTTRLYMLTMALSASLAAVAGILITVSTTGVATHLMWLNPLAMSFAIVILGGLGSIKGTFIGAFIVGYAQKAFLIISPEGYLSGAVALAIMVLVLLIRPKGLFGKHIELE